MRVFVTGATGFIGAAIVRELMGAGHSVVGLTRSDAGAAALTLAGAEAHWGNVEDLASLREGAAKADAVIHTAFIHDFARFQEVCEIDRRAITALGEGLSGTEKMLIITSGTGMPGKEPGIALTEVDSPVSSQAMPRAASEEAAAAVAERGVRVAVVRLPQVHDTVRQGLVSYAIQMARAKGVAAYVGEGSNRWPAAHRDDVARLYRLALEKGEGGVRYHAVAEEGIPVRSITETIGQGLRVPVRSIPAEQAAEHFMQWDIPASSAWTRKVLGWNPAGPPLLTDLKNMHYA